MTGMTLAVLGGAGTREQAVGAGLFLRESEQGAPGATLPSRLWIYWHARRLAGEVGIDAGATYENAFRAIADYGFPPEDAWPYSDADTGSPLDLFRRAPSDEAMRLAFDQRLEAPLAVAYHALDESAPDLIDTICAAIAHEAFPVLVGADVDEAFCEGSHAPRATLDPPTRPEGGHAMVATAYWTTPTGARVFKVRNSWGRDYGNQGYVHFSEAYMRASELWLAERVPTQRAPR